jgi:hypothetical protein
VVNVRPLCYDYDVTIRKVEIMGEDIMCDLWFESQYEIQDIYWEAEAEVIMAHYDEPDFF